MVIMYIVLYIIRCISSCYFILLTIHPCSGLVVARAEPPPHILVVQDLDLEGEVLLHVLDDHDEVGQLDAERLLGIRGTRQEGRAHVGADNL